MLYDPNQGRRSHLGALRAWLAFHPPTKEYDWMSGTDCLLCRYHGKQWNDIIADGDLDQIGYNTAVRIARGGDIGFPIGVQTYGAALARCEAEMELCNA